MTFAQQLAGLNLTAAELMARLPGLTQSAAYAWLAGKRQPPAWAQPLVLARLGAAKAVEPPTATITLKPRSDGASKPTVAKWKPGAKTQSQRELEAELARLQKPQFKANGRL